LRCTGQNRCGERIAGAHQEAEFEFAVHALAEAERRRVIAALGLAQRAAHRGGAGHDGRRTVLATDGHPFVVGQQRVVEANHLPTVVAWWIPVQQSVQSLMWAGRVYSALACTIRPGSSSICAAAPSRSVRDSASRSGV
jgi:hypothetical protein